MDDPADIAVSGLAAAIGEPARTRILFCLLDGRARTSTELAIVAEVSPSTASSHLSKLKDYGLIAAVAQGKHRYYKLQGPAVASALEALIVVGAPRHNFVPNTPSRLRGARTCYDHMAGEIAVSLNDRFKALGWLVSVPRNDTSYDLTEVGTRAFAKLGIDVEATRALQRRFACACTDWSERRPHLAGALGAAFLKMALQRKWVLQDLDSRALKLTRVGQRAMNGHFGLKDYPQRHARLGN